jgi:integrase
LRALLEEQRARTSAPVSATGEPIPTVFHRHGAPIQDFYCAWRTACAHAALVGRIPHDFRRTAVRNLERAGVSRSVAMQLTGHKTEAVYRRYAIVAEADLREGVGKLAALHAVGHNTGTISPDGTR